jgi:hypothetical protein
MEKVALEIIHHLADDLYEYEEDYGQRWPVMLESGKRDILSFRSVCRAFRDASWIPFRDLLAERSFYLSTESIATLNEISHHDRLSPLVNTLTFGGKLYNAEGLRTLEERVENHQLHCAGDRAAIGSPIAWQRSLSSTVEQSYELLVRFHDLYLDEYNQQERLWRTGEASQALSEMLSRLPALRAIRICPWQQQIHYSAEGPNERLLLRALGTPNPTSGDDPLSNLRSSAWRDLTRILSVLSSIPEE